MWIFLVIIILLIAGAFIALRVAGGGSFPWLQFYAKGKESGFSFKEINLLRKIAVETKLENPASLFWSIKQLDKCIRGIVLKYRAKGKEHEEPAIGFISKLYEFRKRVEFDLPKYKMGLKSTRSISPGQRLKITFPGVGTFNSQVVENLRKYLAISYPEGKKLPMGTSWKGQRINIYFWRAEDAGYVFQTKVIEDFFDRQYPILHVAHSDSITRSQKRNSVRVDVSQSAKLFPLKTIDQANEEESTAPGLRCRLVDISEDGAAVLIGGRAKVGLPIKIQTPLGSETIVMSGTVKGVTYDQKRNQSVLHVQAVPPSLPMRNKILAFVYNIFNDRDN
ncbi:MAG: flagellar brake protein [Spirochaetia bacterium]